MSPEEMRRRAEELRGKMRRQVLMSIPAALFLAAVAARGLWLSHTTATRTGFSLLTLWALHLPYQVWRRSWPRPVAADAALVDCAEFYRKELERQLDYQGGGWKWFVAPLLLGIVVVVAPAAVRTPGVLAKASPFLALMGVWVVAFFVIRKREREKIQRELEALKRD